MVNLNWKRVLGSAAMTLAWTISGNLLLAQEPPAEPATAAEQTPAEEEADPPGERPAVVEEITVTAQKREESIQEVPLALDRAQRRRGRDALRGRCRRKGPLRARAEPAARIVVRPRLPALLHPRLRQHRLRPQRLAAGLAGRTTTSCRKTRSSRASRSSTSTRSKCCAARRARCSAATPRPASSSSTRGKPTDDFDGYVQRLLRHLQHDQPRRRRSAAPIDRHAVGAASRCSTSTATTGSTTPSPGENDALDGYDERAVRAAAALYAPSDDFSALFNVARRTSTAPRACSAPTSSSRAQRARRRLRPRRGRHRRPERAAHRHDAAAALQARLEPRRLRR